MVQLPLSAVCQVLDKPFRFTGQSETLIVRGSRNSYEATRCEAKWQCARPPSDFRLPLAPRFVNHHQLGQYCVLATKGSPRLAGVSGEDLECIGRGGAQVIQVGLVLT